MATDFWSEYRRLKKKQLEDTNVNAPVKETTSSSSDEGSVFWDEYRQNKKDQLTSTATETAKKEEKEKEEKKAEQKTLQKSTSTTSPTSDKLVNGKLMQTQTKQVIKEDGVSPGDIAPVKTHGGAGGGFGDATDGKNDSWIKKSEGNLWQTILGSGTDLTEHVTAGAIGVGEKIVDALTTVGTLIGQSSLSQTASDEMLYNAIHGKEDENVLEKYEGVKKEIEEKSAEFIAKDLYDEEAIAKTIISDPMRRKHGINSEWHSIFGEKSDELAMSAGQLGVQLGANVLLPGSGIAVMGASTFGSEVESAFRNGATFGDAVLSASISTAAEVLTERLGGISFGGKTVTDSVFGELSSRVTGKFARALVAAGKLATDASFEAAEEVVSGYISAWGQTISYMDDKEIEELFSKEDALDAAIGGFVLGGVFSVGEAAITGRDPASGLTKNEQAVVDKEVERRVAEQEKGGKKLTTKEIGAIEKQVQDDMEHGQLDIEMIEEVLGGDSYTAYKDTVESEDGLKAEYEQLATIKKSDLTTKQEKRLAELEAMNLDDTTKRDDLRKKLNETVFPQLKDSKLAESYNQVAKKGEAFKADLSKYKGKQREAVERAMKSGVLNDTFRSHELVDVLSKIEAEKGIVFDYTNNAKLKESGFALEGKTVNGFANRKQGSVTLNVQSAKAWQSVVGHEITHVLEGTEHYEALRSALYAYAESRGELESRKASLTELYDGLDADIDSELTADLVGDYLFTDKNFVNKLAGNRTLFQKVRDEITYLWNVATGKEKTEIEKVKDEFDRVWKELKVKNTDADADDGNVQLSLSSIANTFYGDENMSAIAFEESDYKQTDGYKNYVNQCLNNMRQTRADFDEATATEEIENQIDGIVRVALAAKKAGYDIHDDATKRGKTDSKKRLLFSSLEPNSEYFTSNDISTICDKRKNFAEIYDDIVRAEEAMGVPKGKRFFDNVDNYFYLHNILAQKGLTQPCRQCYVESMRKNLAPMANAFLRLVNETDANNKANDQLYQPSGKNKGQLKTSNAELRERVLETFEAHPEYGMSVGDLTVETLTTEDGLAQLKIQAPLIYEAFNSFYGQSKPKMPKAATPFRFGELTALLTDHNGKIKQSLVDKINSTGGFRLQSYSDFQIQNYTDVLQVIFEAGTLGLNGHAYTKVPAFLEATEGTNLKRNISIFMYKDGNEWKIDRNDSFPYTLEEIYDIVKSDASGNTSIIAVSQNKEMSAWIMANDYVGQGIPFHKSGMKMGTVRDTDVKTEDGRIVKGYSGTIDHTKQQTEVWAKANADHKALTKVKKGINIYSFWDFDNKENLPKNELIEKNVKEYIRQCEIAGYLPKFRDYVMNNESVLKDVLRYAKELGFVEQNATIDDISFKYEGKYHSYTIPYGYYKFLGDFGMFKPDGTASPHDTLSLNGYDFDKAEEFFADAESLRRNEILQQFANGEERQKYRESNLDAGQLDEIIHRKRQEVVDEIVAPVKPTPDVQRSLSKEDESYAPVGNYSTPFRELALDDDIAPVAATNVQTPTVGTDTNVPTTEEEPAVPKSERIADGTRSDELLYESLDNYPMKTIEQKIAEKIRAVQGEIADKQDLRKESWDDYESRIAELRAKYNAKKNKNTKEARGILESIARQERLKASREAEFAKRISDLEARLEKMSDPKYARAMQKQAKMEADAKWAADLLGDTSTWKDKKLGLQYATNTERRNLRDIVRDVNGNADIAKADYIDDALNGRYNQEEAAKKRELAKVRDKYAKLKITKAEDVYIQMRGEFLYNPDTTLTEEDIKEYYEKHKSKIDAEKVQQIIRLARKDYDNLLNRVNAELKKQGMKEIPYRQGYFPHFTEPKQNFIQKLLNWKTQDNEIPTSIAGLTETFKPTKSWQSFDKARHSDETDYSFMKGFDSYSEGALDWIYHMDTLQKRRAVENHIRFTHSDEGIQAKIREVYADKEIDATEAQARIENILAEAKNPLNNFVQDFTTHTNILAGKKNSLDRTVEQATNRHIYSVMTNVQNRMSANMVLANVRSALTNFIPITQSWAQVSPLRSLQATKDTIANAIKDDGMINKSTFLTNRLREADKLYQTNWDKVLDKAGIMFEIVDNFSSQVIWRSKYNQNLANGMSESEAIKNADQFSENVMAGRSKGNEPTLFNAKNPLVKAFTMFQLEVNNQYGYLFKDVPNDLKAETKHWQLNLAKGYTTAFIGAYVYNALLEKVTGSNAALDPIGIIEELLRDLGLLGDDEEEELTDTALNFIGNVAEELPFVGGVLGGGRIPISSAIPYGGEYGGGLTGFVEDVSEGNWGNIGKEMMSPILNVGLPVGGGQLKKTYQGLKMFSDEHPVTGSYTDSGNLRFPVEDTVPNRIQAALFGQWANENARDYIENKRKALSPKQVDEYVSSEMTIGDYWDYREGLSGLSKIEEKAAYINGLDIPVWKKNLLINNLTDRKDPISMEEYATYGSIAESDFAKDNPARYELLKRDGVTYEQYQAFDDSKKNAYSWAAKNPEKYEFIERLGYTVDDYAEASDDEKDAWTWAYNNPEKYEVSKAITGDLFEYRQYKSELNDIGADKDSSGKSISGSRKEKVIDYINSLDADYGEKLVLFKSEYPADDTYNNEIIDYLNGRDDLNYEQIVTILKELGFKVSGNDVTW